MVSKEDEEAGRMRINVMNTASYDDSYATYNPSMGNENQGPALRGRSGLAPRVQLLNKYEKSWLVLESR